MGVFSHCEPSPFTLVAGWSWKVLLHSQHDIHAANFLQKFDIASENSLCYLFALTTRRKLNELFAQFDNVTPACQFHNAIYLIVSLV